MTIHFEYDVVSALHGYALGIRRCCIDQRYMVMHWRDDVVVSALHGYALARCCSNVNS